MARGKQLTVYLMEDQAVWLDEQTEKQDGPNDSRSYIVRQAIEYYRQGETVTGNI